MALTPQTTRLINAESIQKMKQGARLINCARGELVDEAALAAALKSGHLSGAGLDVFTEEPPQGSPLLGLPNVIATPHIAGSTHEAQEAVGCQIAVQVREFLLRGVMQNAVNVPSVSHEEYLELQPYIVLAERMGSFLAQASDGSASMISLRYSGHIGDVKTQLVRNAAVAGVLNAVLDEKANLVNAAALAESRGIQVKEAAKARPSGGSAESVITVELTTSAEHHVVKGTVLHGNSPRLLAVDGIDVEAPLQHSLIYMRNRDVPGVIGRVGTILAEHGINIANFSLGREEAAARDTDSGSSATASAREAVALVHVDSEVPAAALQALRAIPAVMLAKSIRV
jgi:D-3-phosphoglycerate dehydrogenase